VTQNRESYGVIKFGSTRVFSLLQAISKLNTISKAFQTLKTLTGFDCPDSSQQKIFTYQFGQKTQEIKITTIS